jgi:hypothetical protein
MADRSRLLRWPLELCHQRGARLRPGGQDDDGEQRKRAASYRQTQRFVSMNSDGCHV